MAYIAKRSTGCKKLRYRPCSTESRFRSPCSAVLVPRSPGSTESWFRGILVPGSWFRGIRVHGTGPGSWEPGLMGTGTHGNRDSWELGFLRTEIPANWDFGEPGFRRTGSLPYRTCLHPLWLLAKPPVGIEVRYWLGQAKRRE